MSPNSIPQGKGKQEPSKHHATAQIKGSKLKLVFYLVSLGGVLLLFSLYLLLASSAGNQFLLKQIQKFEPRFAATLNSGNLVTGLQLSNISWKTPELTLAVDELSLSWDWSCLQDSKICLEHLSTQGLNLFLRTSATQEPELEQQETVDELFTWPLHFALRHLSIKDAHLDVFGDKITWDSLELGLDAYNTAERSLTLTDAIRLSGNKTSAQLLLKYCNLTQVKINLSAASELSPPSTKTNMLGNKQADIQLPEIQLPFALLVDAFDLKGLVIQQEAANKANAVTLFTLPQAALKGRMQGRAVHLDKLSVSLVGIKATANGDISLNGGYPVDLLLDLALDKNEFMPATDYQLMLSGSVAELKLKLSSQAPLPFSLSGQVQTLKEHLPFDAKLRWQELHWPIIAGNKAEFKLQSKQGSLSLVGSLQQYRYLFDFDLAGTQLPQLSLSSKGKGDLQSLAIETLNIVVDEGLSAPSTVSNIGNSTSSIPETFSLSGKLDWQLGLLWQGDIAFDQVSLSQFNPSLTGQLSGSTQSYFKVGTQAYSVALADTKIAGLINGLPVQLLGGVKGSYPLTPTHAQSLGQSPLGEWHFERLELSSGENTLKAKGKLSDSFDLAVDLNLAELSDFYPSLHGKVDASLQLSGLVADPLLNFQLNAHNLKILLESMPSNEPSAALSSEELSIANLMAKGQAHVLQLFNDKKSPVNNELTLTLNDAQYMGYKLTDSNLSITGHRQAQHLSLSMHGQDFSMKLKGFGGLTQSEWQGGIQTADLVSSMGNLLLKQELALKFDLE